MNKSFKVLWNKARAQSVVTDEHKHAYGKGKTKSTTIASAPISLIAGSALAMLLMGPPQVDAATTITPGWTHTTVTPNAAGTVHDIRTDFSHNSTGINKFTHFELEARNIANLHMGANSRLINFVNDQIQIRGIANAVQTISDKTKVGGELFFVSPGGMVLGSTGVINAGRLGVIAPTQKEYEKLTGFTEDQLKTTTFTDEEAKLVTADVPLNPEAIISINGSINVANQALLAAGKIQVGSTARITSGIRDFANLVNVSSTTAEANDGVSAGLTADNLTLTPTENGDIELVARVDGTLQGSHTNADEKTQQYNDDTANSVAAPKSSVTNTHEATITVDAGAEITSAGKATIEAAAGAGAYKAGSRLGEKGTTFEKSKDMEYAVVKASVTIAGKVTAQGDLTTHALADSQYDHSMGFNLEGLKRVYGGVPGANVAEVDDSAGESLMSTTEAKVNITSTGSTISQAGNLKITSDANNTGIVGNSSAWVNYSQWNTSPIISGIAAYMTSTSTVTVDGTAKAAKALDIEATNNLNANLSAQAATASTSEKQAAYVFADLRSSATTTVSNTAVLGSSTSSELDSLKVKATQHSYVITTADVGVPSEGNAGLAVNVTKFNTSATTNFAPHNAISNVKTAEVGSANTTETLRVISKVDVGDTTIFMKVKSKLGAIAGAQAASAKLAELFGGNAGGEKTQDKWQAGGAFTYVGNSQSADTLVNQSISTTGALKLTADSTLNDHRYQASAKQEVQKDTQEGAKKVTGAFAVLVAKSGEEAENVSSHLIVGSRLAFSGSSITFTNNVLVNEFRGPQLFQDAKNIATKILDNYNNNYYPDIVEGARKIKAALDSGQPLTFQEIVSGSSQTSVNLTEGFKQLGTGLVELAKAEAGVGSDLYKLGFALWDLVNPGSYANAWVSAGSSTKDAPTKVTDLSGSVGYVSQNLQSRLEVGAGTQLTATAGTVTVSGSSYNGSVALGGKLNSFVGLPLFEHTSGNSIGGNVIYQALGTDNLVILREGVNVTSQGNLSVQASDQVKGYSVTAGVGLNSGANALISGLSTVVNMNGNNRLSIDDEVSLLSRAGNVYVNADRNDDLVNIAGDIQYGAASGSSLALGAGIAVVLGDLNNALAVEDNDTEEDADGNARVSTLTLANGSIVAEGDTSGTTISATHELDMNTIGVTAMVQKSSKDNQSGGSSQGGSQGGSQSGGAGSAVEGAADTLGSVNTTLSYLDQTMKMLQTFFPAGTTEGAKISAVERVMQTNTLQKIGQVASALQTMQEKANKILGQNEILSGTIDDKANSVFGSDASALQTKTNFTDKADISQSGGSQSGSSSGGFKLNMAGSFAWNNVNTTNKVKIAPASGQFTVGAKQNVNVMATTDHWEAAWAGAGGASLANKDDKFAGAIAGAVAVNKGTVENLITINGLKVTSAPWMNVFSTTDGTLVAEGLGLAVSTGGQNSAGLTAGVSVNEMENTVSAEVSNLTMSRSTGADNHYYQIAWVGDTQVTGGTGISVANGSQNAAAAGGTVAIADITNTIKSTLANSTLTHMKKVNVSALTGLTQVSTSVGVQVAKGNTTGVALDGSYVGADLTNTLTASATGSSIDLTADGELKVVSQDTDRTDVTGLLGSTWVFPVKTPLFNAWLQYLGKYDDKIGEFKYEVDTNDNTESQRSISALYANAKMRQISVALGIAGSSGKNGGAGSAAIIVNNITNTFNANTSSLTVTNGSLTQAAKSGVDTVSVAAGVAGSSGQFSAAGSVIVEKVKQTTNVSTSGLTSSAATNRFEAQNTAVSAAVAGNLSISTNSNAGALGAAVVVNEVHNNATVTNSDSSYSGSGADTVVVLADNATRALTGAINGSVSSRAAIGGSVAVARAINNANATISNMTLDGGVKSLAAKAEDKGKTQTLSGALSISTNFKESASVAGAVSYVALSGTTGVTADGVQVKGTQKPDLSFLSNAAEEAQTLTAAGTVGGVGVEGAVSINNIDRNVSTNVSHIYGAGTKAEPTVPTAQNAGVLQALATNSSKITNIAGNIQVGVASLGAGVSKNYINDNITSTFNNNTLWAKTARVEANNLIDIDTIGVGAGVSTNASATGSLSFNKVMGTTSVNAADNKLTTNGAMVFDALSDVTFGVYSGTLSGSGSLSIGLSVATTENDSSVETHLTGANVLESKGTADTLTVYAGVADGNINNTIVSGEALKTSTSLAGKRTAESANGIYVGSLSTATYKNFAMNLAGSAMNAAQGTVALVTHKGNTTTEVGGTSALTAVGNVAVKSGDYDNMSGVLVGAVAGGTNAVGVLVTENSSARRVKTTVNGASLTGGNVYVNAEGKEGVSSLTTQAEVSAGGAFGLVAAITKQKSSVENVITNATIHGTSLVDVDSHYFNRVHALGLVNSVGMGTAASGNVVINLADNQVFTTINGSQLTSDDDVNVDASRETDWNYATEAGAVSFNGFGVALAVNVNNMKGKTVTALNADSELTAADTAHVGAKNLTMLNSNAYVIAGSLGSASVGVSVMVNHLQDTAAVDVIDSSVEGANTDLLAQQNRLVSGKALAGGVSLGAAAVAANVLVNVIGEDTSSYEDLLSMSSSDNGDSKSKLAKSIRDKEALNSQDSQANKAVKATKGMSAEEAASIISANDVAALATTVTHTGTKVNLSNATVKATTGKLDISALEDPTVSVKGEAKNTGLDYTVIGGAASLAYAGVASVGVSTRHVNAGISISDSTVESAQTGTIKAADLGVDDFTVEQGSLSTFSGGASVAKHTMDGNVQVAVDGSTLSGVKVNALHDGTATLTAKGLTLGAVAVAANVARLSDSVNATASLTNGSTYSGAGVSAIRSQELHSIAFAGMGGGVAGVGADAGLKDSGKATVTITGTAVNLPTTSALLENGAVTMAADNRGHLEVASKTAGGGGVAIGVVLANLEETGEANLTMENGSVTTSAVNGTTPALNLWAVNGRNTGNPGEAMKLKGQIAGYGGGVIDIKVNKLEVTNKAKSTLKVSGTTFDTNSTLVTLAGGHTIYEEKSDAKGGGAITSGNSKIVNTHATTTAMTLTGVAGNILKAVDADIVNSVAVDILGESAGGGLVDASLDAINITNADTSTAKMTIGGEWQTVGRFDAQALTDLSDIQISADNTKGAAGVATGTFVSNELGGDGAETSVRLDDGTVMNVGDTLSLSAVTNWGLKAYNGHDYVALSKVYGAAAGSGIGFTNNFNRDNVVSFGQNSKIFAVDSIFGTTKTTSNVKASVLSKTAGGFTIVGGTLTSVIDTTNHVVLDAGSSLRTSSLDGKIALTSTQTDYLRQEAGSKIDGGVAGASVTSAKAYVTRNDTIDVKSGSTIRSGGSLTLASGANENGVNSSTDMETHSLAYAAAAIAAVVPKLDTKVTFNDKVNIAGSAVSTTNATITADSGDYTIVNDADKRYWGSLANNGGVKISMKALGEKETNVEDNATINVTGSLIAGLLTKANITITGGLIYTGSLPADMSNLTQSATNKPTITIDVGDGDDEVKNLVAKAVGSPVSQSMSNIYASRYRALVDMIATYSSMNNLSQNDSNALVAYRNELTALRSLMLSRGLLTTENGYDVIHDTDESVFIPISNLTVSGGKITMKTNLLQGAGTIKANAAQGINIDNQTTASLALSNVVIGEKGGAILLNGAQETAQSLKTASEHKQFTGTVSEASSVADPKLIVKTQWNGGEISYRTDGHTETVSPISHLVIQGKVANMAGDMSLTAQGDIMSGGNGSMLASGTLSLSAGGSITQSGNMSNTEGLLNIGGDISSHNYGSTAWGQLISRIRAARDNTSGSVADNNTDTTNNGNSSSRWVAGGQIFIAGSLINLNGYIQSGFSEYGLNTSSLEGGKSIAQVKADWQRAGSPQNINVKTGAYLIQAGGATWNDNKKSFDYKVRAWYDPVNDRIVLDDVTPQGGAVYITGKIASTGGGNIKAADGAINLNVDSGTAGVRLGNINTSLSEGIIKITDLFYFGITKDTAQPNDPAPRKYYGKGTTGGLVSEFTSSGAKSYFIDTKGNQINKDTGDVVKEDADFKTGDSWDISKSTFETRDNLYYTWTEGIDNSTEYYADKEFVSKWWGLASDHIKEAHDSAVAKPGTPNRELSKAATISDTFKPSDTGSALVAWNNTIKTDAGQWNDREWFWKTGFLGFYKHHRVLSTKTTYQTDIKTFAVKADNNVGIGFLQGQNTINITSGKDIQLAGSITTKDGTLKMTANGGSITSLSSNYSISGLKSATLTASGSIGSSTAAITLKGGSTSALALSANAKGGDLFLDANNLSAGMKVNASELSAKGVNQVAVRGDLNATKVRGRDISLSSKDGNLTVTDLVQTNDLLSLGSSFSASAAGDINLTVTSGDLAVDLIQSTTSSGNINITLKGGSLYDSHVNGEESTAEQSSRYDSWVQAGLINADGTTKGNDQATDIADEEQRIRDEFTAYTNWLAMSDQAKENLTAEQKTYYGNLQTTYSKYADAADAIDKLGKTEGTRLYNVKNGDYQTWTAQDLVYSLSETIANAPADAKPMARSTNIKGNKVTITTTGGSGVTASVGNMGKTVSGNLSTAEGDARIALLKELAMADVGDYTMKTDGTLSVTLKRPVIIDATDFVNITAKDNVFVSTSKSLKVGQIISQNGIVRLTTAAGLLGGVQNLSGTDVSSLISGKTVTIRGGAGGIGDASNYIRVHTDQTNGWVAATAGNGIYLTAVGDDTTSLGNLVLYALNGGGKTVSLQAANMYSYTGDSEAAKNAGYVDLDSQGYIQGSDLQFDVTGSFGTATQAFRLGSNSNVTFSGTIGNFWAVAKGEGNLHIAGINATGTVDLTGEDQITLGKTVLVDDVATALPLQGKSLGVTAKNGLTVIGNVQSTGTDTGDVLSLVSTLGGVSMQQGAAITSASSVNLVASGGELSVSGGNVQAATSVNLEGKTVNTTGGTVHAGTTATLNANTGDLSANNIQVEAAGKVTLSAAGAVNSDQATLTSTDNDVAVTSNAGNIVLTDSTVTASKGNVALSASKLVNIEGSGVSAKSVGATATADDGVVKAADSQLTATATNVALTAGAKVDASGASLTASSGDVGLTSRLTDVDMDGATVTSKSLTAEAVTGALSAQNLKASVTNAAQLTAKTALDLTRTSTDATRVINAGSFTGTAKTDALTATGVAITTDTGALTLEGQGTDKAVTLTNAKLSGKTATSVTSAGSLAMGNATASGATMTLEAAKALTADAATLTTSTGLMSVKSTNANVSLEGANLTANALTADAKTALNMKNAVSSVTGAATLNAGTTMDIQSTAAGKGTITAGSLTATADDAIRANKAVITTTSTTDGKLHIEGKGTDKAVSLTDATLTAATDAELSSKGNLTADRATIGAATLTANATKALSLQDAVSTITGAATLTAGTTMDIQSTTTGKGKITAASLMATAADAITANKAVLATSGTLKVQGTGTDKLVTLTNAQLTSSDADVTVLSAGELVAGAATLNGNTVELQAAKALTADAASLTTDTGLMSVKSTGANVSLEGAAIDAKSLTADAKTALNMKNAVSEVDGAATLNAGTTMDLQSTTTGKGTITAGSLTATAADVITADKATIETTSGALHIEGTGTDKAVSLADAKLTAKTAAQLISQGNLTADRATIGAATLTANAAKALSMQDAVSTITGAATLDAGTTMNLAGTVADKSKLTAATLTATAGDAITADKVVVSTSGNLKVQGTGANKTVSLANAKLTSTDADVTVLSAGELAAGVAAFNGNTMTLEAAKALTADAASLTTDTGLMSVKSTGANVSLEGATIDAKSLTADAKTALNMKNAVSTVAGAASLNAGTTMDIQSTESGKGKITAGSLTATAADVITADKAAITTTSTTDGKLHIEGTGTDKAVSLTDAQLTAATAAELISKGNLTADRATVGAATLTADASKALSMQDAVSNITGAATLNAGTTMDIQSTTAGKGTISAASLTATAADAITATKAVVTTTGNLAIHGTGVGKAVAMNNAQLTSSNADVSVISAGTLDATSAALTGQTMTLSATNALTANSATLEAKNGLMTVKSTAAGVSLNDATVKATTLTEFAKTALSAQRATTTVTNGAELTSDGTMDLSAGTLQAASLTAMAQDTLTANSAHITTSGTTSIEGKGTTKTVSLNDATLSAQGGATLKSAGDLTAERAAIGAASLAATAAKAMSLQDAVSTVTGAATLNAGTTMDLSGTTANKSKLTAGSLTAKAADAITADKATIETKSGALHIEGTGTDKAVSLADATLTAKTAAELISKGNLTADRATVGAATLTADASKALSMQDAVSTITGAATLNVGTTMDIQSTTAGKGTISAASLTATAGDAITADKAVITTAGNLNVQGNGVGKKVAFNNAQLQSTNADVIVNSKGTLEAVSAAVTGQTMTLSATNALTANSATLEAKNGLMTVKSTAAGVSLNDATVKATTLTEFAKTALSAQRATTTVTNGAELRSDGTMDLSASTLQAASLTATAQDTLTANGAHINTTGTTSIEGKGTNKTVSLNDATLSALGGATLKSAGDLAAARATIGAATLTATAAKVLSLQDAVSTIGGVATLNAGTTMDLQSTTEGKGTMSAASLTATAGDEITGTKAVITTNGNLALQGTGAGKAVALNNAQLTSNNADVSVTSAGTLTANAAALTGNTMTLSAPSAVSLDNATLTTRTGLMNVQSTGANVAMNRATVNANSATIGAATTLAAADLTAEITNAIAMTAGTTMDLSSDTAGLGTIRAASLTATAGDALDTTAAALTTSGDLSMTSQRANIAADHAHLTVGGTAGLTAQTSVAMNDATLSAHDLSVTATTGNLDANRTTATVTGATTMTANNALTANAMSLTSGVMTLTAERGDLTADDSVLTANTDSGEGNASVNLNANAGSVLVRSANINTARSVHSTAQNTVDFTDTAFVLSNGGARFLARTGDIDLTRATGLSGSYLDFTAGGSVKMAGLQVEAEELFQVVADGNLVAEGMEVALGTDAANGDLTLKALNGSVDLAGSNVHGKIGNVDLLGANDVNINGVLDTDKAFSADSVKLTAGNAITLGDGVMAVRTVNDITMSAATINGGNITAGSSLTSSAGNIALTASAGNLAAGTGVAMNAANDLSMTAANGISMADTSRYEAAQDLTLTSGRAVDVTGNVKVLGNTVGMTAAQGDIALTGDVVVGDESAAAARSAVTLTASGNITQMEGEGDTGLRGETLTLKTGGALKMDAFADETSAGNAFNAMSLDVADGIAVGLADRENTTIAINAAEGGAVNGNLSIHGQRNGVTLTNGLAVSGGAAIHAMEITGSNLVAGPAVTLTTALYDRAATDGIHFTGNVSADAASIYTNSGNIAFDGLLKTNTGKLDVYRQNTAVAGTLNFNRIESATTAIVYNANGNIAGGSAHTIDTMYLVTGVAGQVTGRNSFTSDLDKVGVVQLGQNFTPEVDVNYLRTLPATTTPNAALPFINSSNVMLEYTSRDSVGSAVISAADFRSPTSTYFSLSTRTDAALATIPVTTSVVSNVAAPVTVADTVASAGTTPVNLVETDTAVTPAATTTSATESTNATSGSATETGSTGGEATTEEDSVATPNQSQVTAPGNTVTTNPLIRDMRPAETEDNFDWIVSMTDTPVTTVSSLTTTATPLTGVTATAPSSNSNGDASQE